MIYDRYPNLQNKWNKAFWARGHYVATIGNMTEETTKKYIAEQIEEPRKEDSEGVAFERKPVTAIATLRFLGVQVIVAPWGPYHPLHLKRG